MKINIEKYLSEEDKERIAEEEWTNIIRKQLVERFKDNSTKAVENYERVISNSVHRYLTQEINKILDVDHEKLIRKNVKKTIDSTDYTYNLFQKRSVWEKEDSRAVQILNEAIEANKSVIQRKVYETIDKINPEDLVDRISNIIIELVNDKLISK